MNHGTIEMPDMTMTVSSGNSYRVEVSGWDARENFFVEKTSLDWREREGKTVALHAQVRLDCVLFVRLLRPLGGGADFPVPHRAVRVKDGSADAACRDVGLEQMQPQRATKEREREARDHFTESRLTG
jgi:hypothetical protein